METKRISNKRVVKTGGRKKISKCVNERDLESNGEKANEVIDNLCGVAEPSRVPCGRVSCGRVSCDVGVGVGLGEEYVMGSREGSGERVRGISKVQGFYPFIHPDLHVVLDDIPVNRIDDFEYINFHIYTIWFCSKLQVPIPKDMNNRFEAFNNFPFFASLFHIRNNLH